MSSGSAAPSILCHELPAFQTGDLESVRRAFRDATACPLRQSWRPQDEPELTPGVVRTGWQDNALWVFAELTDRDIFSNVTGLNQNTWELGDAFEMFLRPVEQKTYVEFHVTPNNQRLQLRIPGTEALRHARQSGRFHPLHIPGDAISSIAWTFPESQQWIVLAHVPVRSVCDEVKPLAGGRWLFSFCRYDYTRGHPGPVLSSTSPHLIPDFHSQKEWGSLSFVAGS